MENDRILDLNELEMITGGVVSSNKKEQFMKISCPHCFEVFETDVQKSKATCPSCKKTFEIKG